MLDKQVLDWVNSEKSKGFSEEQIRQQMLQRGYKSSEIRDYFSPEQIQNPPAWKNIIFSFILIILSLALLALPLLESFENIKQEFSVYIFISLVALFSGSLTLFIYRNAGFTYLIKKSILTSIILAAVFSVSGMISMIISTLVNNFSSIAANSAESLANIFASPVSNSHIGFTVAMIGFNLPIIIALLTSKNKDWKMFLLYLIPIILYTLLFFIFSILTKPVLPVLSTD